MIAKIIRQHRIISDELSGKDLSHDDFRRVFKIYRLQLANFRHERLVHLIITMFVALFSLLLIILNFLAGSIVFLIAAAPLIILTGFYIYHYFRLENAVQSFEDLAEKFLIPSAQTPQ